jgi:hypothetical protein
MVQVVFNWEDGFDRVTGASASPSSLDWEPLKIPVVGSWEYYFLVYVERTADGYHVTVTYNSDLFTERTITHLMHDYETLLQAVVEQPRRAIAELWAPIAPPRLA